MDIATLKVYWRWGGRKNSTQGNECPPRLLENPTQGFGKSHQGFLENYKISTNHVTIYIVNILYYTSWINKFQKKNKYTIQYSQYTKPLQNTIYLSTYSAAPPQRMLFMSLQCVESVIPLNKTEQGATLKTAKRTIFKKNQNLNQQRVALILYIFLIM